NDFVSADNNRTNGHFIGIEGLSRLSQSFVHEMLFASQFNHRCSSCSHGPVGRPILTDLCVGLTEHSSRVERDLSCSDPAAIGILSLDARACSENFFGILGLLMHDNIESHLVEKRIFKPPRDFVRNARIKSLGQYQRMYRESIYRPAKFWAREASELVWRERWKKVLEWKAPFAKWFVGGKLNISENCLDRHLNGPRRNKAAIIWEGEPGDKRTLTYQQLHREVCRFANVLKRNKIKKGDRVIIYLPNIPETAIAMLACARIGAVHSVVFGGFSSESIRGR